MGMVAGLTMLADHNIERLLSDPPLVRRSSRSKARRRGNSLTAMLPMWARGGLHGTRIAFVSARNGGSDLYSVPAVGGSLERLTVGARLTRDPPLWSPDGSLIAFQIADGENYQVGAVRLSDRARSMIASSSAYDGSYAWAPDGKRIGFISGRDGFVSAVLGPYDVVIERKTRGTHSRVWSQQPSQRYRVPSSRVAARGVFSARDRQSIADRGA